MVHINPLSAMLFLSTLFLTAPPALAQQSRAARSWLDQPLVNWNRPAGRLPLLPRAPVVEGSSTMMARCREQARQPTNAADKALVRHGWKLFGAVQSFGTTRLVMATAGYDGMCRPMSYQSFVYVEGSYAGTLSPVAMNSRTDGAMVIARLISPTSITAEFARYKEADALCCPSKTSTVFYTIRVDEIPDLTPTRISTHANCQMDEQSASTSNALTTSLYGKRWMLAAIGEQSFDASKLFIEFDREQQHFSGSTGCNRISGGFAISGSALKFSGIASTKRACLGDEARRAEASFMRALAATTRFEIEGDTLRLYANDSPVLMLKANLSD